MALTNNTPYQAIKDALVVWADSVLGSGKSLWLNTDYPRVAKPYCTLEIQQLGASIGIDDRVSVDNAGARETTQNGFREMILRVQVYTAPPSTIAQAWPKDLLNSMLIALQTRSVIDAFRAVPMSYVDNTRITGVDDQEGDRWEWIAACDLRLNYSTELFDDGLAAAPDDGGFVEQVEITIDDEPTFIVDSTP